MTNEEIDKLVRRNRNPLRSRVPALAGLSWIITTITGAGLYSQSLPEFATLEVIGFAASFLTSLTLSAREILREKDATLQDWDNLRRAHVWGNGLTQSTNELVHAIRTVYALSLKEEIFPLRQAVRVIDTHHRQQQRLQLTGVRLRELHSLQTSLTGKITQLRELGEDYPQGERNLQQLNGDVAALSRVQGQIIASCTRLETIVIGVQKAAQSRQLRNELEGLSARITRSDSAIEPAFAPEALEDIERQIGREIETYLQLERETDEHLG